MANLNILCSDPHKFFEEVTKKLEKYIRKVFVTHQKFSKMFHGPSIFA